ncbi:CMP-N-acetylneuraminate-beta-1,4-galactoside alpha-2,3-sialyltransferase-like isoform X4 [Patiria miniata]|uniref:Lactosylceramide alpha-2,3-sialyltransferase n=1 Tax=Patiria miniata TaxID=46514 RepID=A0A914BS87_PATMI|nr:CMP-N-acetylneuraminate-beta-1,4-galactoside alpha-2,3-sialyltransferase-like isoform X4 [Patiria miniata]
MGVTIRVNIRTLMYILVIAMVLLMLDLLFMMSVSRHKTKVVKSPIDMDEAWIRFDQQNLHPINLVQGSPQCQRILLTGNHDQLCAGTKPETEPEPGHTRGNFGGGIKIGGTVAVPINRTVLASPNVTCTANRSRNRMLNIYGAKFNLSTPVFLNSEFETEPHILDLPFPFGVQDATKSVRETLAIARNTSLPLIAKRKSCLRCVIVGNGGLIKDTSLGKVIDNFDVVLRINDAPTKGYEKDVGSKTTMRMCYPESTFSKPDQFHGDWLLLMMVFKPLDLIWLQTVAQGKKITNQKGFWKKIASTVPKKPEYFRMLNPSILRETGFEIIGFPVSTDGKVGKNVPTSGCLGIMLSLRFCDEVAIAGFGYDTSVPNAPLHYYDKLKMKEIKRSWTHSVDKEQKMLYELVDQGVIQDLTGGLIRT